MEKQNLSEPEAFKWIQRAAMDRRTTMKAVACRRRHSVSRTDYALVPLTAPKPGGNVKSVQQGATPVRLYPQNPRVQG